MSTFKSNGVEKPCYLCLYNTQGGVLETSTSEGENYLIPVCASCVRRYDLIPPARVAIRVDPSLGPFDWKFEQN